jgi:hypothetical protein
MDRDETTPGADDGAGDGRREPPESAVEEAERLTRLAREAADGDEAAAYRDDRDARLAEHGFTARVRSDDGRDVLVVHPQEWVEDGTIRPGRVDDVDRAVEVPLSGAARPDDWSAIEERNRRIVDAVREEHGDVHGDNAAALADFMGNHYAKPIGDATAGELREFLEEYFPRNAFPSERQEAVVGRSIELAFRAADEPLPEF